MKKLIIAILLTVLHSSAFAQSYNIQFDIIEEASPLMGKGWDFSFNPHKTMTVKFDGTWIEIRYKDSGKIYLHSKVNSVRVADIYDRYNEEKLNEKNYILEVIEKGNHLYYIIKYSYISKNSMLKSCYIPYMYKDGRIVSYTILQSDFIAL